MAVCWLNRPAHQLWLLTYPCHLSFTPRWVLAEPLSEQVGKGIWPSEAPLLRAQSSSELPQKNHLRFKLTGTLEIIQFCLLPSLEMRKLRLGVVTQFEKGSTRIVIQLSDNPRGWHACRHLQVKMQRLREVRGGLGYLEPNSPPEPASLFEKPTGLVP